MVKLDIRLQQRWREKCVTFIWKRWRRGGTGMAEELKGREKVRQISKHSHEYTLFSSGPRLCVGRGEREGRGEKKGGGMQIKTSHS